eukprot:340965-Pyramimonas_sp.AAC.1
MATATLCKPTASQRGVFAAATSGDTLCLDAARWRTSRAHMSAWFPWRGGGAPSKMAWEPSATWLWPSR